MKWAVAVIGLGLASVVGAQAYKLPDEKPISLPKGAGVELVEAHCSACFEEKRVDIIDEFP